MLLTSRAPGSPVNPGALCVQGTRSYVCCPVYWRTNLLYNGLIMRTLSQGNFWRCENQPWFLKNSWSRKSFQWRLFLQRTIRKTPTEDDIGDCRESQIQTLTTSSFMGPCIYSFIKQLLHARYNSVIGEGVTNMTEKAHILMEFIVERLR